MRTAALPADVKRQAGFTLVELLVAVAVMALMAILSWRGLDGMARAQALTRARGDDVMALQAGLAQWGSDLDAIVETPGTRALDWDGRALRITRRGTAGTTDGLRVVAWSRRALPDGAQWWLRWESPPLTTRGDWQQAWQQAALWAQNAGEEQRRREVAIAPMVDWQIVYYRNNTWTNPLSSDAGGVAGAGVAGGAAGAGAPGAPASGAIPNGGIGSTIAGNAQNVPDGVRLVLQLAPGRAIAGTLVRDWVNPVLPGGNS